MGQEGYKFVALPMRRIGLRFGAAVHCADHQGPRPGDMLVKNAGITRDMTFKKMDMASWDAVIRTNLDSVFTVTKPVFDGMSNRDWGRIMNISSVSGRSGPFGQTNYSAAKAGMDGFAKALALEVARWGVTVNTISPGYLAPRWSWRSRRKGSIRRSFRKSRWRVWAALRQSRVWSPIQRRTKRPF